MDQNENLPAKILQQMIASEASAFQAKLKAIRQQRHQAAALMGMHSYVQFSKKLINSVSLSSRGAGHRLAIVSAKIGYLYSEPRTAFKNSLISQVEAWIAGKSTNRHPLSEKQLQCLRMGWELPIWAADPFNAAGGSQQLCSHADHIRLYRLILQKIG